MIPLAASIPAILSNLSGLRLLAQSGDLSHADPLLERGASIALVGLVIVFAVLVFLSLSITALPKIVAMVDRVFPAPSHSRGGHSGADHSLGAGGGHPESQLPDDVVIAAIGYVLHTEFQNQSAKK